MHTSFFIVGSLSRSKSVSHSLNELYWAEVVKVVQLVNLVDINYQKMFYICKNHISYSLGAIYFYPMVPYGFSVAGGNFEDTDFYFSLIIEFFWIHIKDEPAKIIMCKKRFCICLLPLTQSEILCHTHINSISCYWRENSVTSSRFVCI